MSYFILIYGKYDTWPYHRRFDSYDEAIEKGIRLLQKGEYNKIEIWKMSGEFYFVLLAIQVKINESIATTESISTTH